MKPTLVILLWLSVLAVADNHGDENHIRRRTRVVYDVHSSEEGAEEAPVYSGGIADLDGDWEDWERVLGSPDMSMDCISRSSSSKSAKKSSKKGKGDRYVMSWWSK
jgi:hypothetical protein